MQTFKDDSYIVTYFMVDSEVTTYRRTVFSFLDMFAQIGGVYQVVSSIMFLFLGFYAERMMYYCVLRKCYQLDSHDNDDNIISSPMPLKTASNRVDQSHNEIGFPSAHVPDKNIVKSIHQVERNNDRDCVEYSRQNNSIDSQE